MPQSFFQKFAKSKPKLQLINDPIPRPLIEPAEPAWQELKKQWEKLSDATNCITSGLDKEVVESKEFEGIIKSWWGEGRIAKLQKKYFSPLEQAQLALNEVADFIQQNDENLRKSDVSDSDIKEQMRSNSCLQAQHVTLIEQCREEKIKRCLKILDRVVKQLGKEDGKLELVIDGLLIFNLKIKGVSLSREETDKILNKVTLVNNAYKPCSHIGEGMSEAFSCLKAYEHQLCFNKAAFSLSEASLLGFTKAFDEAYACLRLLAGQKLAADQCDALEKAFDKAQIKLKHERPEEVSSLDSSINKVDRLIRGFRYLLSRAEEQLEQPVETKKFGCTS